MRSEDETLYDRLLQWQQGKVPGPWTISIYPTYRCNIQCKLCWKREFDEPLTAREELDSDRMLEIVDEAAEMGVREWIVGGGGELMLRSKIVMKMLRRIRSHGMNGVMQTNGTRFTDKNLEELVDMQWRIINVSIDGPNAEINNAIRFDNNFERSVDTIKRLQRIKQDRGSEFPQVCIVSVVTNLNYKHLKEFVKLHRELDLREGKLSCVDLIVYGDHDKQFELTPEQRAELPKYVREAIALGKEYGIEGNYHKYLRSLEEGKTPSAFDLYSESEETVTSKSMCFEPFSHMLILPEGVTGPCCTFYEPKAENAWTMPLKDVWTGPYMQSVRKGILNGKAPNYCKECMPTRIEENRVIQSDLLRYETQHNTLEIGLGGILAKAGRSLSKNGVAGSIKRGREWMQIRKELKERVEK